MGFALKKLTDNDRARIAGELFEVKNIDHVSGEMLGLCPIHGESNPSFSYNFIKDAYYCQSCGKCGDLISLWCHVHGHTDQKEGFKLFCAATGIDKDEKSPPGNPPQKKYTHKDRKKTEQPPPIIPESIWEQMPPLPEPFIKRLQRERGWSPEKIKQLDLRLQTIYQDDSGAIVRKPHADRVAIPIRNDSGQLVNIRLYKPGAKIRKITSWGKGLGSAQLYPPGSSLNKTGPVLLIEGESDTICGLSHNINNVITQTSKLVNWPESHLAHFRNRDVIIAYDADQAGQQFAASAAESLLPVVKSIKLLAWPAYMGCQFGYWPMSHGEDLTDFFVKHAKTLDEFNILISESKTFITEKSADTSKAESNTSKNDQKKDTIENAGPLGGEEFFHLNSQGRWTFKSRWLADKIRTDIQILYDPLTSSMFSYNSTHWEDFKQEHLESMAIRYLGDESSSSRASDAANQARLLSILPHGREMNDSGMMCLENGMLDIRHIKDSDVKLVSHAPEHYATYKLPISLKEDNSARCSRWLQYLSEAITTPEVIMQVQEFAGYCLTRETRYAKALVLLGPGSDGKTTFINVIEQLVGERNIASVSLKDLEDQFYRSGLYNKLLCTSTEISKEYFDSQYFKAIVTGDTISAARKNKDPFEFKPFCKFIFAGNELPRSRDNSDGYFRRILPIRFKRQFFGTDEDKHLDTKLKEEISEIFKWALAGLQRLLIQDGFTASTETDELLLQYRIDNNPVMAFVDKRCILGSSYEVNKDGLYRKYRDFCEQYNYKSLNRTHFFRDLNAAVKNIQAYRPQADDGKRIQFVKGIGLLVEE